MLLDSDLADEILEILRHENDVIDHVLARVEVRSLGPVLRLLSGNDRSHELLPSNILRNGLVRAAIRTIEGIEGKSTRLNPEQWGLSKVPRCGGNDNPAWAAYLWRLRRSAEHAGVSDLASCAAAQATVELAENVLEHSESPSSGLAYFDTQDGAFEVGMIDTGMGMLSSLRRNDSLSSLRDDLAALREGIRDGVSRFDGMGRGFGFRSVFRVLQNSEGTGRLRSGTASLDLIPSGSSGYEHIGGQSSMCQGLWVNARLSTK